MVAEKNVLKIQEFMQNILLRYRKIQGKDKLDPNAFWDAVVISASDVNQKKGYEKQIKEKQNRKDVPLNVPFHVFADPPAYKIGCGGSTMFVLDKLSTIYENTFQSMRILLIPAGGYSQRLPNLSALGKLFCHLPFGDSCFQMLDLILASYLPFLNEMPPGVFLASSDAIISYSLNDNDFWSFRNEGFTALAHPSPISVGLGHGVYVLPTFKDHSNGSAFMSDCLCVLQKPSMEEMHEKGAVVNIISDEGDQEVIFSDSTFFFDHKIVRKLVNFYKNNYPLTCELSSYGDFLQPLGAKASPSYIVDKTTDKELAMKKSELYRNLYGTNLSILVLNNSFFHHLGTMKEYLDSFCFKNKFSESFPISKFSFCSWSVNGLLPLYLEGTFIHSIMNPMSCVEKCAIIEYCDINISLNVGSNCILSNIQIEGFPVQRLAWEIPDNTLMHTAAVESGFVTIACSIKDDIKKVYQKNFFQMDFFGKKLKDKLAVNVKCFSKYCNSHSLWNAKLFPVKNCPKESFMATLKIISCIDENEMQDLYYSMDEECIQLLSIGDILRLKDTEKMMEYQKRLYNKIKLKVSSQSV